MSENGFQVYPVGVKKELANWGKYSEGEYQRQEKRKSKSQEIEAPLE